MPTISVFYGNWAKLHQDELLENWRLCESMQAPNPILPLK